MANLPLGTQRYRAIRREDEDALTQGIVQLASQYVLYGYRRTKALLRRAGWRVSKDRVERIWRREGLKVPQSRAIRTPVAERWIVRAAKAGAAEPYIELRLRQRTDA